MLPGFDILRNQILIGTFVMYRYTSRQNKLIVGIMNDKHENSFDDIIINHTIKL